MITLYNSLTRKLEEFKPIKKGRAGLYTCGPTVYNYAHIGNLRSYVFANILARVLRYNFGEKKVKWVMNITDIDDKTIRDSKIKYPDLDPMEALKKFTAEFEKYFWQDLAKLNISEPDRVTHAADIVYIKKMQDLIKKIFDTGYAYAKDGSVYFDVAKYSKKYQYGQLVDVDVSELKSGARVDADEYEKDNIQDFVLWKGKKDAEPFWEFNLNGQELPGRPGWHIECSAMGEAELGMPFDIHTGGVDLKFPHHENEIHQSVIGYGVDKPVNYWLHNEHLLVDGQRMGKRFNNFYTIKDLETKKIDPLAYRYLCLLTHYRKQLNFSWEALEAAQNGLAHLYNCVRAIKEASTPSGRGRDMALKEKFISYINNDLDLPGALSLIWQAIKNKEINFKTLLEFDKVLGLELEENSKEISISVPLEVQKIITEREEARKNKNWEKSDELRKIIEEMGYKLEDTTEGAKVSPKK